MKSFKVKISCGLFHVSGGNTKVQFPIINVGSGTDCPSRAWCPFDAHNYMDAGRKKCYAQKTETLRPRVLASRRLNEHILRNLDSHGLLCLAIEIAGKLHSRKVKIVRLNESSDLADWNINFIESLVTELKKRKIKVYLYSKAPLSLRSRAIGAGATVLHSERDFVAYGSQSELEASGAVPCPGKCGPCKLCPSFQGGKIGILEH